MILYCYIDTRLFECSESKKGKSVKSDDERKVRKEFENCIFYRQQNSKQNWLNNRCLRFIMIINYDKALQSITNQSCISDWYINTQLHIGEVSKNKTCQNNACNNK